MSKEAKLSITLTLTIAMSQMFNSHLPPLYDTRVNETPDYDFRAAEAQVAGIALFAAGGISVFTESWYPLVGVSIALAIMLSQYELALRAEG